MQLLQDHRPPAAQPGDLSLQHRGLCVGVRGRRTRLHVLDGIAARQHGAVSQRSSPIPAALHVELHGILLGRPSVCQPAQRGMGSALSWQRSGTAQSAGWRSERVLARAVVRAVHGQLVRGWADLEIRRDAVGQPGSSYSTSEYGSAVGEVRVARLVANALGSPAGWRKAIGDIHVPEASSAQELCTGAPWRGNPQLRG